MTALPLDHPVFSPGAPRVFAHRGGAALRPENTMAAFDHGLAAGADGLELDVRLARDGEVVVIHDATLDRTTDATGKVEHYTAAELARVDAAARFHPAGAASPPGHGTGVPRLAEVFARHTGVPLIVELKGDDPRLAAAVVELVRATDAWPRVCLASFSDTQLRAVRRLAPHAVTSAAKEEIRRALYGSWLGLTPRRPAYRGFQVPERFGATRVVSRRFVRLMHARGLPTQVWTVNDPAAMRRLLGWGVSGLITDRPDIARQTVDAHRGPGASR